MRPRRLIWTTPGGCTGKEDENVEDDAGCGDSEDNGCDGDIDPPEISRESTAEEQQGNLQHQWQRLHHIVEVPGDNPVELSLTILTAFDRGSAHVGRCVSVQPLLS